MSLDPSLWAETNFKLTLDPWQIEALQSTAKESIWNISRQAGKSFVASLRALHKAIYSADSLILVISPSERQSHELYLKFLHYYDLLESKPGMIENKALSCTLENGSRVIALPDSESTVQSFSAVSLIMEDEAAYVSDELHSAVRPMLAVSKNDVMILMSTPKGKRGHFFELASDPDNGWEKVKVTADQCPRISKEFLESERKTMPDASYRAEYFCDFNDAIDAVFTYEQVSNAFSDDIAPLIMGGIIENSEKPV